MKKLLNVVTLVALTLLVASPALAQRPAKPFMVEAHAGYYLPTGDIADAVDGAFGFGGGFGYSFTDKIVVMGEVDFGSHSGAEFEGETGPDVDVLHFMGKVGYVVFTSADGKLKILVNAGAGALNFSPDAENADSKTYFAINAGAKLYYMFTENVGIVVSPQGDIAFTKEEEIGTSNAWVWPFSAGLAFNF